MKNIKKCEQKKRRAIDRRVSEGDAEHFASSSGDGIHKTGSWMNIQYVDVDDEEGKDKNYHTDSDMASSMEEASQISNQKRSWKQTEIRTRKEQSKASQQHQQSQTQKKLNSGQSLQESKPDLIFGFDL